MTKIRPPPEQIGFLEEFDRQGSDRATAHLPSDMEAGIAVYRELICQFDAALKGVDMKRAEAVYEEAHTLAVKLNNGEPGILADDNSPGRVLARETAAPKGVIPMWGQEGEFEIAIGQMRVRIELEGIMGIGWLMPSFSANAVELDRSFLSNTGYRSFAGVRAVPSRGMTPADWVTAIVEGYVRTECKGKLVAIDLKYRKSEQAAPSLP